MLQISLKKFLWLKKLNPYEPFGGDINVKVDWSNYATKADLKNISHVDASSFTLKSNLASLKTEVDKLDIGNLVPVPIDLSKPSDVVKNDVVKKVTYDKLVEKVNKIDVSGFVLKNKYDTDKTELENKIIIVQSRHCQFVLKANYIIDKSKLEKKIRDTSKLVKKTDYNTIITEIENKSPNISNLTKITDFNTKVTKIEKKLTDHNHDEYITTPEFNDLAARVFAARLKQANLVPKTDLDDKLKSINQKINSNKVKHFLVENELKKNCKHVIQFTLEVKFIL